MTIGPVVGMGFVPGQRNVTVMLIILVLNVKHQNAMESLQTTILFVQNMDNALVWIFVIARLGMKDRNVKLQTVSEF